MKTFQIITDSSCDLPQELADKLDLQVLPLHFTIGGQTYANYLDGREIGFHDFFERIRQGEEASTSAVNPESFREAMEKTLQQGLDILFIGFSSGLSTTYQSGAIACDELREKYADKTILLVCHGGVCRVIETYYRNMTRKEFSCFFMGNCELRSFETETCPHRTERNEII